MPQREDGKHRATRIDLGYYRRRSWLDTFRWFAISVGLILSVLYGAWVLSLDRQANTTANSNRSTQLSTGPLALVHAHFENDCQNCHSDQFGIALAHDAWQQMPDKRLNMQEEKCNTCHRVDSHARAMLTRPEMDRDCARCHRDHLGRANLLVAVKSAVCTECHRNLTAACLPSAKATLLRAIDDFSIQSHGIPVPVENTQDEKATLRPVSNLQFRSLLSDPGRVRFDHTQHMRPGQVDADSRGGFQLSMLPVELRKLYAQSGQQDNDLVQLKCESCHIPSAIAEWNNKSAIAREERRFYAPINFNKHCEACHQISFAGQGPNNLPLPHVAQREEYADLLEAKQNAGTLNGELVTRSDQATAAAARAIKLKNEKIDAGVAAVFVRCHRCHLEKDTRPEVIAEALAGTLEPLIPQRWLQYGNFNHAAHDRITRCAYCHPMPTSTGKPQDQERVLIRGPESCVSCHRGVDSPTPPEFATESKRLESFGQKDQPTWASSECVECHRYHWSRSTVLPSESASASE